LRQTRKKENKSPPASREAFRSPHSSPGRKEKVSRGQAVYAGLEGLSGLKKGKQTRIRKGGNNRGPGGEKNELGGLE